MLAEPLLLSWAHPSQDLPQQKYFQARQLLKNLLYFYSLAQQEDHRHRIDLNQYACEQNYCNYP